MKSRLTILIVVLGIGAVLLGWVYESQLRTRVETRELVVPDNIDYFLANLKFRAIDDHGKLEYALQSPRLEHFPRGDLSRIETPALQIYSPRDDWQVVALEGEFRHADNLLYLRRDVVMNREGVDPLRLSTESIRFEPARDFVTTEAEVVIETHAGRIEAERASFDLAAGIYRFTRSSAVYHNDGS
ncbi:MAG TPA: LPS export ABC transporter periplasmic protein LptC [Gammaproteobacteria bacterium]|jgi:LPS export ABC transporter protein LptC